MTETTESLRTTPATPRRPDWMRRLQRPSVREAAWGFVFIGPWLIGLVLFTAGPMVVSFLMSMTDFDLVNPDRVKFVGIDNYVRMAGDPTVHQTLVATITFAAILIPVTMLASLAFAVFLNHPRLPGKGPLRAL